LIVAAIVCAIVAIVDLTLHPLYTRGVGQRWISHANGLSTMLSLPGLLLVVLPGLRQGQHTSTWVWLVMQALNFAVYTAAVAMMLAAWQALGRVVRRNQTRETTPTKVLSGEPRVSRRRLLLGGAGGLATGAVAVYPMSIATRHFEVTRRTFGVRDLPPELAGLRIVQLSDIHHGPWIPIQHVRTIVATANALKPDVILLTGDYVHRSAAYITPVVNELAKLRATIGIVGVLGNHDWWEDGPLMQREFARVGIPLIDNARRFVTPQRRLVEHATAGLCLAGVGDLYTDTQRYDAALGNVPAGMPRLLLSHNPDVAEDPALAVHAYRVDLMLCGHTHGGQIYIPGIGSPIVPSQFGAKYARGLVQGPVCPVFISRGLGHTVLPVRIGVRPEMAVIELATV
jgi:predicted MPP superfamily phosphohydrolase